MHDPSLYAGSVKPNGEDEQSSPLCQVWKKTAFWTSVIGLPKDE